MVRKRQIAEGFKVDRSKLQRYMKKIKEAKLDLSTISDENLCDFISDLSKATRGKTVFIHFIFIFIFILIFIAELN